MAGRSAAPAAAAGVAAVAAGMGAGHLLGALVGPGSSPVYAVASWVVDLAPTWLKEAAIGSVGTADKPILLVSVTVVALLLGAVAGMLHRRGLGTWLLLVLAAVCGLAAYTRPVAGQFDVLPSLATGLVGVGALTWLGGLATRAARPEPPGRVVGRRQVLGGAAAAGVGGIAAGTAGQLLIRGDETGGAASTALPPLPQTATSTAPSSTSSTTATPRPATPSSAASLAMDDTPGISPFRTPVKDFYRVDTALFIPRVDARKWRLTIDGDVAAPYELTYAELMDMPMVDADITLNCVSNRVGGKYVGSTRWRGVLLAPLLERARIGSGADQILSTSTDGMTISTPVGALLDDRGAMLAVGMDGKTLTAEHGFPVRMITPGLYGYVGATKWVRRLTATTYAAQRAYWSSRGWSEQAEVKTQARIDTPEGSISAGSTYIAGVAWSQASEGISRVDVRIDSGTWQRAELGRDAGEHYWRQWRLQWAATKGTHRITVRAYDGRGQLQTSKVADRVPNGATGLHTVRVSVR